MATPEGKVKAQVNKLLDKYGSKVDRFWPVPNGMGPSHLDCIVCAGGHFLSIETKAPGKKPTARQNKRIGDVQRAGGMAFVVDGTNRTTTIDELAIILDELTKRD